MTRFLTFVHRSPYATWNSLQAWIRRERSIPERITILHLKQSAVTRQTLLVERGIRTILTHYGGSAPIEIKPVPENTLSTWRDAITAEMQAAGDAPLVIDVTPARTVPKLAITAAVPADAAHVDLFYLDVEGYRYESKPFPSIPYNVQTVRSLLNSRDAQRYRRVQFLGAPPNATPLARIAGLRRSGPTHREVSCHWEDLIVLLNEASASTRRKGADGIEQFEIKLPTLGVTLGSYNLENFRLRLKPFAEVRDGIQRAIGDLTGLWQHEIPQENHIVESLTAARLLQFKDQTAMERELHEMAAATRGPNRDIPHRALGLDTNLFYFDFVTALSRAAGLPTLRIPVVASSISRSEIQNQTQKRFPRAELPTILQRAEVERPLMARLAHAADEEFERLRTRCRMYVIHGEASTTDAAENDARIVRDLDRHAREEKQELIVYTNDHGLAERAATIAPRLDVRHARFGDVDHDLPDTADVDQVAYLVHRLAIGYGKVSLKGLNVEIVGDHPDATAYRYAHEEVRVRLPETEWAAGFLHERTLRPQLDQIVREEGLWVT